MKMTKEATPRQQGFKMPAEWAHHAGTFFAWPHLEETFPGHLREAQNAIAQSIKALTKFGNQEQPELAKVLVRNQVDRHSALERLRFFNVAEAHFELIEIPTNDVWIRDYGPIILTHPDGQRAVVSFRFDGWGGKDGHYYGEHAGRDDKVASRLAKHLELPCFESSLVLEGGAIEVDGEGTLLTTENCLLERSSDAPSREVFESTLSEFLGIDKVVWLPGASFDGDDTEGHIDNITRFVGSARVVTAGAASKDDPWYDKLETQRQVLSKARDAQGRQLEVIPIPLPSPHHLYASMDGDLDLHRYPASPLNFIIGNQVILVPVYGDPNDRLTLDTLASVFPSRNVIPIDSSIYILGQGSLHCSSQQEPSGK